MKKLFCVLFILALTVCTAASAERHLEVQCTFTGSAEGTTVYLDQYEQNGGIVSVSSLFPENAVMSDQRKGASLSELHMLFCLRPETVAGIGTAIDQMIKPWLEPRFSEPVKGEYAGELFNSASSLRECSFPLSDLTEYLKSTEKEGTTDRNVLPLIDVLAGMVSVSAGTQEPILRVKSYDEGNRFTVMVMDREEIFMTASADRAGGESKRWLISYMEDGLYCFRDISISSDPERCSIRTTMSAGTSPSLHSSSTQRLFTDTFVLTNEKEEKRTFVCTVSTENVSRPLVISGTAQCTDGGPAFLNAAVSIEGSSETDIAHISATLETLIRPVSTDDKAIVHSDNEKESAGIMLTAVSNATLLAAEVLPELPTDYQSIILKFFYP